MKQPDQNILAEQNQLQKVLSGLDDERVALNDSIRKARQKLDEHTKKHGDMNAKQAGFERHQAWLNRPVVEPTPEDAAFVAAKIKETGDWLQTMCGTFWDKLENGVPIPFAERFEIFHPDIIGPLTFEQFRPNAMMADLVIRLGLFPSLTEARKAGHNKPLTVGEHRFKNGKSGIKRVIISECK
jgi:hypothetical protein